MRDSRVTVTTTPGPFSGGATNTNGDITFDNPSDSPTNPLPGPVNTGAGNLTPPTQTFTVGTSFLTPGIDDI